MGWGWCLDGNDCFDDIDLQSSGYTPDGNKIKF